MVVTKNSEKKTEGAGAKAFTLTLTRDAAESLAFLCREMGGLRKSQVISYALTLLAARVRRETGGADA